MIICSYISISCDLFWFIPLFKNANESRWCRRRSTSNNQYIHQSEKQGETAPHSQARNPRQKIPRETLAVEKAEHRLNQHSLNSQTHLRKSCKDTQQIPSLLWVYAEEREMLKTDFAGLWWGGKSKWDDFFLFFQGGKTAQSSGDMRLSGGVKDRLTAALPLWMCSEKAPKRSPHQTSRFGVGYLPVTSCWCVYSTPWIKAWQCWGVCMVGPESWAIKPFFHPTAAPETPTETPLGLARVKTCLQTKEFATDNRDPQKCFNYEEIFSILHVD